jgi:hypothetical protein
MFDYLVLSLAAWRITNLLVYEDGPWDIFGKIRDLIGVKYTSTSDPYGTNVIATAFTCLWCLSPWIGLLMMLSYLLTPTATFYFAVPFALSTMAIVIDKVTT